jgi:DNA-binding beta-propeller fold protein YncE
VLAGESAVMRLDARTGKPRGAPVPVSGGPIAVAADARQVWVARRTQDAVTSLDAVTGRPLDERGTVRRPVAVTLTHDAVWVAGAQGDLERIPRP